MAYAKKSSHAEKEKRLDEWAAITNKVVEHMKAGGLPPWQKRWDSAGPSVPTNFHTGKPYRGQNFISLALTGHSSSYFMTYKQVEELAAKMKADGAPEDQLPHVRRGSKGYSVSAPPRMGVKTSSSEASSDQSEDAESSKTSTWKAPGKTYTVFNAEQIANFPFPVVEARPEFVDFEKAEEFIKAWSEDAGVETRFGGDKAYYSPSGNYIQMPPKESFKTPEDFYATWAHEATHSTGHPSKCNRDLTGPFGSAKYSREEGVADFGSNLVTRSMDIPTSDFQLQQTASYVSSWLPALQNDPHLLRDITVQAFDAADRIISTHELCMEKQQEKTAVAVMADPASAAAEAPSLPAHDLSAQPGCRYSGEILGVNTTHAVQKWGAKSILHDLSALKTEKPLAVGDRLTIAYPADAKQLGSVKQHQAKRSNERALAL